MKIDLQQFQATFFAEAAEHLDTMEKGLLRLEHAPDDTELLNTIFRGAHTIKGAAGTFGFPEVARFTHALESVLDRMRDGTIRSSADQVEVLLRAVDVLATLLGCAKSGEPLPSTTDRALEDLEALMAPGRGPQIPAPVNPQSNSEPNANYHIAFAPGSELLRQGLDPLLILRELAELGNLVEVAVDDSALPRLSEMDPEICYLKWTMEMVTEKSQREIEEVFAFVSDTSHVEIMPLSSAAPFTAPADQTSPGNDAFDPAQPRSPNPIPVESVRAEHSKADAAPNERPQTERRVETRRDNDRVISQETVRVDRERLDKLINIIGELVISGAMVEMEISTWQTQTGRESQSLAQLSKTVRDLQEMSLSLRMVPVAAAFQKMARIVRDLARQLGKQVHFETSGDETELDKTVVDQIGDPLMHMVRNAVDHGIETPAERIAAGKPPEGQIVLRAFHQGGNIYIELEDDGRGLDRQAILRKAIERDLVREGDALSDQEIDNLIFLPGFSTAKQVTDVSGRGVGMDVVRRNVEALQGSLSLRTESGHGSTVIIRLPLTMAIMDGLSIGLGGDVYILPLLSVVESFRPRPAEVKRVAGTGEVVLVRGEIVPLLRVHRLLGVSARITEPCEGIVVIVENQGKKCALLVDDLLGQSQVVIKNLETNFRKVAGIAGATILGDGRVAMILDIFGLMRIASRPHPDDGSLAAVHLPNPEIIGAIA